MSEVCLTEKERNIYKALSRQAAVNPSNCFLYSEETIKVLSHKICPCRTAEARSAQQLCTGCWAQQDHLLSVCLLHGTVPSLQPTPKFDCIGRESCHLSASHALSDWHRFNGIYPPLVGRCFQELHANQKYSGCSPAKYWTVNWDMPSFSTDTFLASLLFSWLFAHTVK